MHDVRTVIKNLVEISEIETAGGWRGWAAVRAAGRDRFSKSEWESLLAEPEKLLEGVQQTLKSDGKNVVAVKYLASGGKGAKVVVKRHYRGRGVRGFFRSMGAPRAMRNFIAAVKISQYGLPVAAPLAAVYHRKGLLCEQSIYISEYVDGVGLNKFLEELKDEGEKRRRIISRLAEQMAEILGVLGERGMWHRDAKATNFMVSGNDADNYKVILTDMDGIKQYIGTSQDKRLRALWQLAASVMDLPGVGRTDYFRMFRAYCEKAGIPAQQEREIYRELAEKAREKFARNRRGVKAR